MNRIIKFRGQRTDGKGWVYGDLLTNYIHHKSGATITYGGGCVLNEVKPETVGQIIGEAYHGIALEIYEGDIIEAINVFEDGDSFTGVVIFEDHTFKLARVVQSDSAKKNGYIDCIRLWNDGTNDHYSIELLRTGTETIRITGNIHEQKQEA